MRIVHIRKELEMPTQKRITFEMKKEAFKSEFITKHNKKFNSKRYAAS